MKKVLYIGPWHHIQPVKDFPLIKEFIYIDTQPRSEFDELSYYQGFYKESFYEELLHKCSGFGFTLVKTEVIDPNYYKKIFSLKQRIYYSFKPIPAYINPTLLLFENKVTHQVLKYYISTNILYTMTPELKQDIEESDALIVSGYHPTIKVLEYFKKPKTFIGYTMTCYDIDDNNETIISMLHKNKKSSEYFNRYLLVSYKKMD